MIYRCGARGKIPLTAQRFTGGKIVTTDILVLGGGIAGIQSSLDLAEMGFKVFLVESLPSIGGKMAQLDKTFPTNDCAI